MPYVANARMYSVNPASSLEWKELFMGVGRQADVDLRAIDHGFPLPLAELWSRPDLACAFMCGFPFALATRRPRPISAPVPIGAPVLGRPAYHTSLRVRADS